MSLLSTKGREYVKHTLFPPSIKIYRLVFCSIEMQDSANNIIRDKLNTLINIAMLLSESG